MRWIWYISLIIFSSLTWLTIFSYPSGGEFDWTIKGSPFYEEEVFFPKSRSIFSNNQMIPPEDTELILYATSSRYYIYSSSKGIWQIRDREGFILAIYESEGIPFFKGERLFHVMSNNSILEEIDLVKKIGKSLWKKVLSSSLISFSQNQDLLALGLAQGDVWILDKAGNLLYTIPSYFLEDSLILGVSLASYEGFSYLAFVEGLNYSFLSIYKLEEGIWNLIGKASLGDSLKREYSLFFNEEEGSFFTNSSEGVLSFNVNSQKFSHFLVNGFLLNVFRGSLGGSYLLTEEDNFVYLSQVYKSKVLRVWDFCLRNNLFFEWLIGNEKSFLLDKRNSYFWVLEKS